MIKEEFAVTNRLGLHARPAALLVQTASKFKAKIDIRKEEQVVNGKSVMGLLMLAAENGSRLVISCDGEDEKEAMNSIRSLFANKFEED
ncbi:MAG: phosphocarrier protein HPr [Elusimicrobia bacterium RIFCSPLOWO2_12_FULL_59_9]|nr:HPr family phosphocarrier protein [Elusimicrobiota bacterium]OGS01332.1 MAG: phosphocarrier protein HPr [Elusimicrobia bacterium RIFCSPLOWO2_12_FULL_59_9]